MPAFYGYPEGDLFYRKLTAKFPKIVRGEGCWLYDEAGKKYLDASGGAFVANLGHGVAEIADAIGEQARKVAYVNGTAFTNEPAEALASELSAIYPGGPAPGPGGQQKAYFLTSGSEAVEAALKLARQYWVESGKPSKRKIIAAAPGYHGNTLLALSSSARGHYKTFFKDWLVDVPMIPAPYPYRCACRGDDRKPCSACTGDALEEAIRRAGPETVAAFIIEPVGGSSTGASAPRRDYFRRVRDICDRHGVLLVADEVLTGMGRTGAWFAMEHFKTLPDITVLGKGLSGGYLPLSAVLAPRRIVDVIAKGYGSLLHAQTFSHTPMICAAGLAALRLIKARKLVDRAKKMGEVLHGRLASLRELPGVGDVRGLGLLAGIELVRDKDSRAPFERRLHVAERLVENAREDGLILWPNVGHADGENGDLVMVAPPFVIDEREIDEIASRLKRALERTMQSLEVKV